MIRRIRCFTVDCDDCRDDYQDSDLGYTVHFATDHDAIDHLADTGWTLSTDGHVRCPTCSAHHLCASLNHLWGVWEICRCRGTTPAHATTGCGLFRCCAQCGAIEGSTFADLPTTTDPQQRPAG